MTDLEASLQGVLVRFVDRESAVVAVAVGRDGKIDYCNEGFRAALGLDRRPLGEPLRDYLTDESAQKLAEIGATPGSTETTLGFHAALAPVFVHCSLVETGANTLILAARRTLADDESFRVLSKLNNQLTNLSRRLQQRNLDLEQARATIKVLAGLIPICSYCKKVRDDDGYWQAVESYISQRSEASFSHGICDECASSHFPELFSKEDT